MKQTFTEEDFIGGCPMPSDNAVREAVGRLRAWLNLRLSQPIHPEDDEYYSDLKVVIPIAEAYLSAGSSVEKKELYLEVPSGLQLIGHPPEELQQRIGWNKCVEAHRLAVMKKVSVEELSDFIQNFYETECLDDAMDIPKLATAIHALCEGRN